jgi:hypothetical protein
LCCESAATDWGAESIMVLFGSQDQCDLRLWVTDLNVLKQLPKIQILSPIARRPSAAEGLCTVLFQGVHCLTREDGTNRLSRNVVNWLPIYTVLPFLNNEPLHFHSGRNLKSLFLTLFTNSTLQRCAASNGYVRRQYSWGFKCSLRRMFWSYLNQASTCNIRHTREIQTCFVFLGIYIPILQSQIHVYIMYVWMCVCSMYVCLFVFGVTAPSGPWPPHSRCF